MFIFKAGLIMLAVLAVVAGGYFGYEYLHGVTNQIPIGISSSDAVGMQHTDVVNHLKKLGFTEVYEKAVKDVTGKELDQEGTVTAVSVSGKTEFEADTKVAFNKRIEVIYRAVKPIAAPLSYRAAKKMDFDEVKQAFESAGFIHVEGIPEYDIKLGWFNHDGEVKEITIAGTSSYKDDSTWRPDDQVIITYHAAKP